MATTTESVSNGLVVDDEEELETPLRPVHIEQDVREMERRKRVEAIMNSKLFREELERVVSESLKDNPDNIANFLAQSSGPNASATPSRLSAGGNAMSSGSAGGPAGALLAQGALHSGGSGVRVVPIYDIRGFEGLGYTKHEKQLRCKLASVYRLLDLFGWTQNIYNHVTARLSQELEHFLINPFGMLYSEVTASSLIKIDMQGNVMEQGTTNFGVNVAGFTIHAAIHAARPDIKCIIHVHCPEIVAVSAMKCGLLSLSRDACLLGNVSYHTYEGLVVTESERESLKRDLGVHNKVMMLRNHGALCCGETIEEAFFYTYHLVQACCMQLKMAPLGLENLVAIDDGRRQEIFEQGQNRISDQDGQEGQLGRKWNVGEIDFEALMRMLDNAGYRTGHTYKQPLMKEEPSKPKSDVELPPAVSSLGYLLEEENLYKDGPLRALLANYARNATKGSGRTKWMNSPNVYQKVEILETGTDDPRRITKWVADDSPSHSTPIKVDSPNQFVPMGTNKKEFKKIQKAMKEGRRAGGITAGPESKVLEGATWSDAEGSDRDRSYEIKVGAASKGIIQRDYQHHATVYKSAYSKNPFDNVTSEELKEYERIIDSKSRGEERPLSTEVGLDGSGLNNTTTGDDDTTTATDLTTTAAAAAAGSPVTAEATTSVISPVLSPTSEAHADSSFVRSANHTLPKTAVRRSVAGSGIGEEETDGNRTFSEGEGDTSRATDVEEGSTKKEKKKKSGLRTPSFLKKKKKEKKKA